MLSEQRVLSQITTLPADDAINVQWLDIISRDGVEISRIPHRKAYSRDQSAAFLAEVEGAETYASALGWT